MTGTGKTKRIGQALLAAIVAATSLGMTAGSAQADSEYGCHNLAFSEMLPALEGSEGVFFRIDPDMQLHHWIYEETLAQMGALSDALAAQGTTLIYAPIPTKALAMPDHLPPEAADLGYDTDLAISVWETLRDRLAAAGVTTLDARTVLRRVSIAGEAPFYGTDPRLSLAGIQALSNALAKGLGVPQAEETAAAATPASLVAGAGTAVHLPSVTRLQLQQECVETLPHVIAPPAPSRTAASTAMGVWPGAGSGRPAADIAIVGTEIAVDPALNFARYAAAATGATTESYAVPGDDPFAAIAAYLTAPDFRERRPRFLVWADPIWLPLGQNGDRPMRELIAAVGNACTTGIPLAQSAERRVRADLSDLPAAASLTLQFDAASSGVRRFAFHFLSADGQRRTRWAIRPNQTAATPRVFMPLSGLWPEGAAAVEIEMDAAPGSAARLTLC